MTISVNLRLEPLLNKRSPLAPLFDPPSVPLMIPLFPYDPPSVPLLDPPSVPLPIPLPSPFKRGRPKDASLFVPWGRPKDASLLVPWGEPEINQSPPFEGGFRGI